MVDEAVPKLRAGVVVVIVGGIFDLIGLSEVDMMVELTPIRVEREREREQTV